MLQYVRRRTSSPEITSVLGLCCGFGFEILEAREVKFPEDSGAVQTI